MAICCNIKCLSKVPTSESETMLCHLLLKDPGILNKRCRKTKKGWCYILTITAPDRVWHSCVLLFLSLLPVSLLDQQGRQRSEECCSKERGEGRRDNISERETDWGQSRTGWGKPGVWWDGGWTQMNRNTVLWHLCIHQDGRAVIWITEQKKTKKQNTSNTGITQNWVGGDLVAPTTVIFTCRLVQNKPCCIWFKQMPQESH